MVPSALPAALVLAIATVALSGCGHNAEDKNATQVVAKVNPLSYQVDALRALMLAGGTSSFGLGWDYLVLAATTAALVWLAALLYPRVAV